MEVCETCVVIFLDFLNSSAASKQYLEVNEPDALNRALNEYLEDYMMYSNAVRTKLVLFDDAVLHLSRICRILRQPAGHALLVGVPGIITYLFFIKINKEVEEKA